MSIVALEGVFGFGRSCRRVVQRSEAFCQRDCSGPKVDGQRVVVARGENKLWRSVAPVEPSEMSLA